MDHSKAVGFAVDRKLLGPALLAASRILRLAPRRDFDLFIASTTPLDIPPELQDAGVQNLVVDIGDELRGLNLKVAHLSQAAYLRVWLPGFLAHRYDRILYLDADVYCVGGDISRLLDTGIGPHALAAVLDREQWLAPCEPVLEFRKQGMNVTRYLNSGVLLIDTARFTEQHVLDRFIAWQRRGVESAFHDQGLLNLALQGEFAQLSPVWNWQWAHRYPAFTRLARPFLLHLTGSQKPWLAHEMDTRLPRAIVEEYRRFLDRPGEPLAFQTERFGGIREPLIDRIRNLGGHCAVWSRFRRQLRNFPDPYVALI